MEKYEKKGVIGEGTFGVVYLAIRKETGEQVAIKRIKILESQAGEDGVSFVALREIKLLQELDHPYIIRLQEVFSYKQQLHLMFPYLFTDLQKIIYNRGLPLAASHIKTYMKMLLEVSTMCFILYLQIADEAFPLCFSSRDWHTCTVAGFCIEI